jgi:ElaB/YqjD/DUF883 family membrane-anchored ribosome-binding protein
LFNDVWYLSECYRNRLNPRARAFEDQVALRFSIRAVIQMNPMERTTENAMKEYSNEVTSEQLITDFKVVVADAEALLKATAGQGGEKLAEVRAKAEESLRIMKARLAEAQEALIARTKEAAKATDEYVHENPWKAIGVAASIGLLIGWFMGRR